jgi:hypothetical protein
LSALDATGRARAVGSASSEETDESDTTYFLLHQLRALNEAIVDLHAYLHRKVEKSRDAQQLLEESPALHQRVNHRQLALLNHALQHPRFVYKIDRHQSSHHVTYQTARTDLLDLVEMGLLEKSTVGRTFIFVPPDDLRARLDRLRDGGDATVPVPPSPVNDLPGTALSSPSDIASPSRCPPARPSSPAPFP